MQYKKLNPDLPALIWGRDNEMVAREQYETMQKSKHTAFHTSLSGLMINPLYPFIAASPDGISSCDCCGKKLLEIKCPYTLRNDSPVSVAALTNHTYCLTKGMDGKVMLSRKHQYYSQVQCQLLVADLEICDFVCWTPKDIFVETIYKDQSYADRIVRKSQAFFCDYLLPELLTHKFKEGKDFALTVTVMMRQSIAFVKKINLEE